MKVILHIVAPSDYEPMDNYGDPGDQHFYFYLDRDFDFNFSHSLLESLTLEKEGQKEGQVMLNGKHVASIKLPYYKIAV